MWLLQAENVNAFVADIIILVGPLELLNVSACQSFN